MAHLAEVLSVLLKLKEENTFICLAGIRILVHNEVVVYFAHININKRHYKFPIYSNYAKNETSLKFIFKMDTVWFKCERYAFSCVNIKFHAVFTIQVFLPKQYQLENL
jgi:hypothetical protein